MGRIVLEGVPYHIENVEHYLGKVIGQSDWLEIDQERVNMFAEATNDMNPLHVDPEWAKENSPFGGPIAHGFLTLSLLSHFSYDAELTPEGIDYGINFGFERVRFMAPVMVGDRIRLRATLLEAKDRGPGKWVYKSRIAVETEKTQKVALNAIWVVLFVKEQQDGQPAQAVAE